MQNLRIFFSKGGNAVYISHLDLMRCMTRALVRANIPVAYTEGFNPRLYMNFTMSLPLGFIGLHESVDIRVDDSMSADEVKERLLKTMPQDIKVLSVQEPVCKASAVAFSSYEIEIIQDREDFNERVLELVSAPTLIAEKIGKQGKNKVVKEINLTEHISDFKISAKGPRISIITLILPSNPQSGVSPTLLMDKIFEILNVTPEKVVFTRLNMLIEDKSVFN